MPRFTTAFLVLLFSTAASHSQPADILKPDPLTPSLARRHSDRWRELAGFVAARSSESPATATFVTLSDDHIDNNGGIKPGILRSLARHKHLVGISLRNTKISNSAVPGLLVFKNRLRILDLYGTRIDDSCLEAIGSLSK